VDVGLSEKGVEEARAGGRALKREGIALDVAFTSYLRRAIVTMDLALDEMDRLWIPIEKSWRLNERHYGGLQGLNKAETAQKHGDDQVKIWRRSFDVRPPPLAGWDPAWPGNDGRYPPGTMPATESLKDTIARVMPYWEQTIAPALRSGRRVMVAAHGNSLRGLMKHLDGIADDKIVELEIPTGVPIVYELGEADLRPQNRRMLGR
jgi:2,3-bisphosphoglycerate-dependent phosphoglycerate mutase